MLPLWRRRLREVQVAARHGRYDDAAMLLDRSSLREFLPARQLAQDVAGRMAARAGERLARGDSSAGWQDLTVADRLGGQAEAVGRVRSEYASRGHAEAKRYLAAGQPQAALLRLEKLSRRQLLGRTGRRLQQIARRMQDAERATAHGHFPAAQRAWERARQLLAGEQDDAATGYGDGTMTLDQRLAAAADQAGRHHDDSQSLCRGLHTALHQQDWTAVLAAADALLAIAPQHTAARQARRQAWRAVGLEVTQPWQEARPLRRVPLELGGAVGRRSTQANSCCRETDTVPGNAPPDRMMLWIDAVGGFLVCGDDQVVLGQPSSNQAIAVPILADLSRRHAVIRREQGAYVLEPLHPVRLDGRPLSGPVVLDDGQMIELGERVRLRFGRPHALSATARLDLASHHKTQPSADAILLLADSCVLGPHAHCHVVCRDWKQDVVLYRQDGGLRCRSEGPLWVDGEPAHGAADVPPHARVEGSEYCFTWEAVD